MGSVIRSTKACFLATFVDGGSMAEGPDPMQACACRRLANGCHPPVAIRRPLGPYDVETLTAVLEAARTPVLEERV